MMKILMIVPSSFPFSNSFNPIKNGGETKLPLGILMGYRISRTFWRFPAPENPPFWRF